MKRSTKAALLSGLIFPGIGHMLLKQHLRGSVLIVLTLAALSVLVTGIFQRALVIVDRISSGDIPLDTVAIAEAVSTSTSSANGFLETAAVIVLAASWLFGIIDAYRLGITHEN